MRVASLLGGGDDSTTDERRCDNRDMLNGETVSRSLGNPS